MFSTLIGNDEVKESLRRLLTAGRVAGSLLFSGGEGVGKKLFALELAKALNCRPRHGGEACGECAARKRIAHATLPACSVELHNRERRISSEQADVAMA